MSASLPAIFKDAEAKEYTAVSRAWLVPHCRKMLSPAHSDIPGNDSRLQRSVARSNGTQASCAGASTTGDDGQVNYLSAVVEAAAAVSELERPGDQEFSCTCEDWNVGVETSERAAKVLSVLYKSEQGGITKEFTGHRDIPWISKNVSYGLFLSDHSILTMQETELVVLPGIMCQNLRGPTYWHLRACLRVGMVPEEIEAIHKVIVRIATFGGKTLDVQRVADVTDA